MEIKMKAAFRFRSSSPLLTSRSHMRPRAAVPFRQALLRLTDQASRNGVCSSTGGEQRHDPGDFWHSPTVCLWWLCSGLAAATSKLTAWGVGLPAAQETTGRKRW